MTLRLSFAALALLVLTACGPSYPYIKAPSDERPSSTSSVEALSPVTHAVEPMTVLSQAQVVERNETKQEQYPCRQGAGVHVCTRTRHIYRPAGFDARLQRADGTVVDFFDADPASVVQGASEVCAHTLEGRFGLAVAGVSAKPADGPCLPLDQAPPSDALEPSEEKI